MTEYVYVWQEAMNRNARRTDSYEAPIIVRGRGKAYGLSIAGPSEIVYTPPDLFKTKADPLKNGVRVFIKTNSQISIDTELSETSAAGEILVRIDKPAINRNRNNHKLVRRMARATWVEQPPIWMKEAGQWLPARGVEISGPANLH